MPQSNFSNLWQPNPWKHRAGIAVLCVLGVGAVIGSGGLALSLGLIGGWQLVAAGGFAAASLGTRRLLADAGQKSVIETISTPAPADIQLMAEKIYKKAGLKRQPVVRIIDTNLPNKNAGGAGNTHLDHGAFTIPSGMGPGKRQVLIGIGNKALQSLDRDEIAAVIAHETGHVMNTHPKMNPLNQAAQSFGTGLLLSSLVFLNPVAGFLFLAAHLAYSALTAKAARLDEDRADRNSYGLFPHRDALRTALETLKGNMMKALYPNGPTTGYWMGRIKYWLYGTHYETDRRLTEIKCHYSEAKKFYIRNGLPDDTGDISGTGNRGMKRMSFYKPPAQPFTGTPPLKDEWYRKNPANDDSPSPPAKKKDNGNNPKNSP